MSKKRFKILLLGLYNSGKSSFLKELDNKSTNMPVMGKIKGPNKLEVQILGFKILYFDFGGMREHREEFLEKQTNYIEADLIYYLIDSQDRNKLGESVEFFGKLNKKLAENKSKAKIIACLHKSDPKLISDKTSYIHENLNYAEKLFKNRSNGRDIEFVRTSIHDHSSLIRAFTKGLIKIFKDPSEIIETYFNDLMIKVKFNGICFLDQDGLILFEKYDETPQAREIILTIGLNMAQMSEKLITYGLGFPKMIQVEMNGWTFFSTFELNDKKRYYMAIYSQNIDGFESINNSLSFINNTISNAMEDIIPYILNR